MAPDLAFGTLAKPCVIEDAFGNTELVHQALDRISNLK